MAAEFTLQLTANTKAAQRSVEKFSSQATRSVKSVSNSFSALKTIAIGAVGFLGARALVSKIKDVTEAASVQDDAINALNSALARNGELTAGTSNALQTFASDLQSTTKIGDETTLKMLALAQSFRATADQSKLIVSASADLAEATGKSLEEAVRQVSKTLGGYAGELGEVNPAIKALTEEQLKSGEAARILSEQYAGAAAAAAETFSGRLTQVKNAFGDVKEEVGFAITRNQLFVDGLAVVKKVFEDLSTAIKNNRSNIIALVQEGFVFLLESISKIISGVKFLVTGFQSVEFIVAKFLEAAIKGFVAFDRGILKVVNSIRTKFGFDELKSESSDFLDTIVKAAETTSRETALSLGKTEDTFDSVIKKTDELADKISKLSSKPIEAKLPTVAAEIKIVKPKKPVDLDVKPTLIGPVIPDKILKERNKQAAEELKKQNEKLGSIISGVINDFRQGGRAGATTLLAKGAAAAGTAFLGPAGQALGPLVELLANDGAKELVTSLIDSIPDIVETVAENLPVITVKLALLLSSPAFYLKVAQGLVRGLTDGLKEAAGDIGGEWSSEVVEKLAPGGVTLANNFTSQLSDYWENAARDFTKVFEGIFGRIEFPPLPKIEFPEPPWLKRLLRGLDQFGGSFGGGGGGGFELPKIPGFATGGVVPAGFPNDTFLARLSSGEEVYTGDDRKAISSKLDQLIGLMSRSTGGSQSVEATIMIDGQFIEKKILQANRNNRRLG